ncbi:hypothetical protein FRX31_012980 [Thalictrum thalictroides]|uniref:Uncharacterized protein n=1 Tax=Thalictrum thalictroides TaxID=46969 RepID=A0A7J6WJ87_THATH|nr:hypothetical protein FRX31_012980 [Thalictrum thalictroides]
MAISHSTIAIEVDSSNGNPAASIAQILYSSQVKMVWCRSCLSIGLPGKCSITIDETGWSEYIEQKHSLFVMTMHELYVGGKKQENIHTARLPVQCIIDRVQIAIFSTLQERLQHNANGSCAEIFRNRPGE